MKSYAFWLFILFIFSSCTHFKAPRSHNKSGSPVTSESVYQNGSLQQCIFLDQKRIPFYEPKSQLFFTKAIKECSREDQVGLVAGSGWTAMGLPCNGATGKLDWKGHLVRPKMVILDFGAHCPIQPAIPKTNFADAFGVTANERLVATLPMMVQYWKVLSTKDQGMGQKVELRSFQALNLFKRMRTEGEPVSLELYGRESSWKPNKNFYQYSVDVNSGGSGVFRIKVNSAKLLDDLEKSNLLKECQDLKPARPCHMMFPKARRSN